jgi:hypothetical protein
MLTSRLVRYYEDEDEGGQTEHGTEQQQNGKGAKTFPGLLTIVSTLFR